MINVGTFCELPGENSGLKGNQAVSKSLLAGLWRCSVRAGAEGKKAKAGAVTVVGTGCKAVPFELAVVIN